MSCLLLSFRLQQLKSNQAKEEEARKARILFVIVILFFICNIPRFVINLEEVSDYQRFVAIET